MARMPTLLELMQMDRNRSQAGAMGDFFNAVQMPMAAQPAAPAPQPARSPAAAPMPAQAPSPAPERRGLLGGFFGPEGRDARARLAIALEGLALNPNQALIGQLQQGIEGRATEKQRNATIEWLMSRGHDDLAAALEAGASPQDVLAEATRRMQPADPMAAINMEKAQLELEAMRNPQPEFRRATPEEAAAYGAQGGQFGPDGRFYAVDVPQGMSIESDGAGGFRLTQGAGVGAGGTGAPTVGQVYNPNEIQSVIGMIDQIAKDPNLPNVVGQKAVVLGGGNKISDMNMTQRLAYGQEGLGIIERIGQLQSNAWLSARQMLKGGGAITDYESQKAEAAVARLERSKSEEEFKQALKDLRDAITEGEAKLRASQGGSPAAAQGGPARVANDAEYEALPSGTQFIGPDGKLRRKP